MDELTKELNAVIGKIRDHREILAKPHWVLVDNRGGFLSRGDWYKAELLKVLAEVDLTLTMRVNQINGITLPLDNPSTQGAKRMASNEHPDMSGNPIDAPDVCDQCRRKFNSSFAIFGCEHDDSKNFCSAECANDYDDDHKNQ